MKASYTTVEEVTDEEYLYEPEESDIELEPTLLNQEYLQEEENYLHEPEESDIELEPTLLDKAIDTLIHANWESIRDLFNEHPEIKEEAWNGLSSEQKRRRVLASHLPSVNNLAIAFNASRIVRREPSARERM